MPKFNEKSSGLQVNKPDAVNHEGAPMYSVSPKQDLVKLVATCLLEDKFYESTDTQKERLNDLIDQVISEDHSIIYILKLARFARNQWFLRSIPIYLLVKAIAKNTEFSDTNGLLKEYGPAILKRADEPLEALSLYLQLNSGKKKMNMAFRKMLSTVANNFDEYQISKYRNEGKAVSWERFLRIVHPKPKNDIQSKIFESVIKGTLKETGTWESKRSGGQDWEKILKETKIGYMALLRNVRNFIKNDISPQLYLKKLDDEAEIERSKQFPFRFLSAIKAIENESDLDTLKVREVVKTLNHAMQYSVRNFPTFDGISVIAVDLSGSMSQVISKKSLVQYVEISALFGAATLYKNPDKAYLYGFGVDIKEYKFRPGDRLSTIYEDVLQLSVGHATNGYKVVEELIRLNRKVDRIIFFTDEQLWDSNHVLYTNETNTIQQSVQHYRNKINRNVKIIVINLAGYGGQIFEEHDPNAITIAGWTDALIKFIPVFEKEPIALSELISNS